MQWPKQPWDWVSWSLCSATKRRCSRTRWTYSSGSRMNFLDQIWLIPLFPLLGAIVMLLLGNKFDPQPPSEVAIAPGLEHTHDEHDHGQVHAHGADAGHGHAHSHDHGHGHSHDD